MFGGFMLLVTLPIVWKETSNVHASRKIHRGHNLEIAQAAIFKLLAAVIISAGSRVKQ
jgi:hypothetical protein